MSIVAIYPFAIGVVSKRNDSVVNEGANAHNDKKRCTVHSGSLIFSRFGKERNILALVPTLTSTMTLVSRGGVIWRKAVVMSWPSTTRSELWSSIHTTGPTCLGSVSMDTRRLYHDHYDGKDEQIKVLEAKCRSYKSVFNSSLAARLQSSDDPKQAIREATIMRLEQFKALGKVPKEGGSDFRVEVHVDTLRAYARAINSHSKRSECLPVLKDLADAIARDERVQKIKNTEKLHWILLEKGKEIFGEEGSSDIDGKILDFSFK